MRKKIYYKSLFDYGGQKDKIEYIDKKLQKDMETVEKTSINNINQKLFDVYGIQTIIKGRNIVFAKEPCIYNGKIQRINPLDMFNGLQSSENNSYNYEINNTQEIIEFKGMIVINEEVQEGKFHIDSNIGFLFIFNNKVLLSQNDEHLQNSNKTKFKSPTLSLVNKSIYSFQIIHH